MQAAGPPLDPGPHGPRSRIKVTDSLAETSGFRKASARCSRNGRPRLDLAGRFGL